eukprot:Rhum_TRINITY_DN13705_c0_g1::Rhum_TRINITY_DN13705_c0_g1_i1::g.63239::m.63239
MAAPDGGAADRFSRRAGSVLFPACGLQGVDPASGVEYVDFAEIDATLCEPFLEMFVQDEGLAAVHYFSLVQEVVLPGVSSFLGGLKDVNAKLSKLTCKERVLVVGSHVLYLCDPSGLFVRTLLLRNIKEVVSGRDGVGIRMADPLYPDILVKAPDPTRLQHVLGRLYEAETGAPLPARECASVRGELRFDSATPSGVRMPCKIIPLRVVRRDDPSMASSSGYPERLHLRFAGGEPLSDAQAAVVGTYAIQPEYQDCLPKWKKVATATADAAAAVPTEVWGCNGGWVVSSLPATVSNILFKSVELAGRSSPHAVGGWEELTEDQVFVPAPRLIVSAGGGGGEEDDPAASPEDTSPVAVAAASAASVSSPRRGLSAAPTFSPISGERRHARKSMIHPCSLGRALGAAAPVASIAASTAAAAAAAAAAPGMGSSASDAPPPTCLSPFSNASDVSGLVRPTVPRALTDSPSPPAVVSGVLSPTLPRVLLESPASPVATEAAAAVAATAQPVAAGVSPDHDPMMSPSFASELLLGPSATLGREASASASTSPPQQPLPPGSEAQQAAQRVELLRQRAAATAAKVQRLRRIEDDVAADRAAL